MELLQLSCSKRDYTVDLLVGTQDPDQTFSDLNEDFAYYRLFQCPTDMTVHSINVNDKEFEGDCPQHNVKLQTLSKPPQTCPKCGGLLLVTRREILKPEGGK